MDNMKKCTRCQEEKPEIEFYLKRVGGALRTPSCKKCLCLKMPSPRIIENKKAIDCGLKKCSQCLSVLSLDKFQFYIKEKRYGRLCVECKKFNRRKRYKNDSVARDKRLSKNREWASKNKEINIYRISRWARNNKERIRQNYHKRMSDPVYYKNYRLKINEKDRLNPNAKVRRNIGRRLRYLMANPVGVSSKIETVLGCSANDLKAYLESKFKPGMCWANYKHSGWHIDHIIPCRAFDLTKESEIMKCFHYSNLQPLWAAENIAKSDKLPCGKLARKLVEQLK